MPPSQPHWKRLTGMGVKKRLSLASRRDNSVVHFMPQSSPCDQAAPAEVTSLMNFSSPCASSGNTCGFHTQLDEGPVAL